jgi:shikimate dehydrogenase
MTDKYAVIGHPVSHSKSPLIHQAFALQTMQDISYQAIEAPLDGLTLTVERMLGEGFKGCNVTVPFKIEALKLCKQLTGRAQAAQAVNTLFFRDGEILGDNTDGVGLLTDIEQNLVCKLLFKNVLLLGAGGAAHGVIWQIFNAGATITVANRTLEKARQMVSEFAPYGTVVANTFEQLEGKSFDVVINATSSSLSNELPPLPQGLFKPKSLAYDMMYGKQSPFLEFAAKQGAGQCADGLGMLVEQAAEAFFKWREVRPVTAPVITQLRA